MKLDKQKVRQAFNRAAQSYDHHAVLQRFVADTLLEGLDVINIAPRRVLDLGAGTGYGAAALAARYPGAKIVLADVSVAMLQTARRQRTNGRGRWRYLCTDAERLALNAGSIDFIFANLSLQWCEDLCAVFTECRRVLKPDGLLLFSTLGPDTLQELRNAWVRVDETPHVNEFLDMHDVGDALIRAGFGSPVLECDPVVVRYDDVYALMRDLRGIGAVNSIATRARGLASRERLRQLATHYEEYRRQDKLPATYEIVYAHAWCPQSSERPQDGSTVARIPVTEIGGRH